MIIQRENTKRNRIAAIGMWDGVHSGHRFLIDFLRHEGLKRGLTPSVVTFEQHPLEVVATERMPRLLSTPREKEALLEKAGADDVIMLRFDRKMQHMSAREFLSMLHKRFAIKALVVGFNNRFGHDRVDGIEQYRAIGRELGMEILSAPEYQGDRGKVSSSIIRALLQEGNVAAAATLLGRPYSLSGTVVTGHQLGRTLGFPTANLRPASPSSLIPAGGVYAAYAITPDNCRREAIVNIGVRPTVETLAQPEVSIEAHILDYAGYIYGQALSLEFVERLRDEKKFPSVEKLRQALAADARKAREILRKNG